MRSFFITILGMVLGCFLWTAIRPTPAAVPCDAQAGQMQPRKLTLEQRVERLEKRIEDHERRLTPTPAEAEPATPSNANTYRP